MNPTTIPSDPLIPNNELYERKRFLAPRTPLRAVTNIVGDIDSVVEVDNVRYDSTGMYLAQRHHRRREKEKHREARNDPRPRRLSTITSPEGIRIIPRLVMMFGKLTIGGYIT